MYIPYQKKKLTSSALSSRFTSLEFLGAATFVLNPSGIFRDKVWKVELVACALEAIVKCSLSSLIPVVKVNRQR